MTTPFNEGWSAGYRDEPALNPYRKGVEQLRDYDMIVWSAAWDSGYIAGQEQGRADLIEKRRSACR